MKQTMEEKAEEYVEKMSAFERGKAGFDNIDMGSARYVAFKAGAEWQAKQNPWRNFKEERPNPNSHILRKMIHPGYQAYGKVIYYADFWGEDRPDKWEQDNDKVVYEWQYINE